MPAAHSDATVRVGDWIVDPALDTLSRDGITQKLEPRTMRLLMCLVDSAGAVVSQDKLLTEVWSGVIVGPASVYQAISQLRKILGDTDPQPTYIATVPRKGYRLVAAVAKRTATVMDPVPAAIPFTPLQTDSVQTDAEPADVAQRTSTHRRRLTTIVASLLLLVIVGAALAIRFGNFFRGSAPESIVVLPFVDMTAEKADQPFCDGLTEELSNWLAQIPTLRVVARTSAFAFRGQDQDVRKIGRMLDINHIVEGSMRRFGDHMRITVQLIDARNGYHLWSADYDRPIDDTIKMQEDISRSVAQNLQIRLTQDTNSRFASRRTTNPQAYQQYILARRLQRERTRESTDQAIAIYRQVLLSDPHFSLAYVGLSYSLLNQGYFQERPISETAKEVEPLIEIALKTDPRLSDVYAVRGALRNRQARVAEALKDLQYALSLNPNDTNAYAVTGRILLHDGRPRDALLSYQHAATLDPLDPRLQIQQCTALTDLARYTEAESACQRSLALQPRNPDALDALSWLASAQGKVVDALRWNAKAIEAGPEDFDLYWIRADLFLVVGLGARAHEAIDQGRKATGESNSADAALARVVYYESGTTALRDYLKEVGLDRSAHATALLEAAYSHLVTGDYSSVAPLVARSVKAEDRAPGLDDSPWYARVGNSYRLDLASAYRQLGNDAAAQAELSTVSTMLDRMIEAGVQRHAVYELRARVHALRNDGDGAMSDLRRAVDLGLRRAWWIRHEPYLASLQGREDFQSLMNRIGQSNDQLLEQFERNP